MSDCLCDDYGPTCADCLPECDLCENPVSHEGSALCRECAWQMLYPDDEVPPEDQW